MRHLLTGRAGECGGAGKALAARQGRDPAPLLR
jgi:hypothetical protein